MTWRKRLFDGAVIPAHPLALTAERTLDEQHQRALTRYYLAAGSGGVAVGVHTTQFAIRDPKIGLYRPVLELAAEELRGQDVIKVAGIAGDTPQAVREAELAASLGYHIGLVSLAALRERSVAEMLDHVRAVGSVMPIFGFYLQPAVGGRVLPYEFWRGFVEIPSVVAIKMAPFNRYQTLDVVRAVAESGRSENIALYTGNDDTIVIDLLTWYQFGQTRLRIRGGLLGHWAVWTRCAVHLLNRARSIAENGEAIPSEWLTMAAQVTDSNAAFFDVANGFHGCIAGLHQVLVRQGLMTGRWCLDPEEDLSPGQAEEIDRVYRGYPHLHDDNFVRENLDKWLR